MKRVLWTMAMALCCFGVFWLTLGGCASSQRYTAMQLEAGEQRLNSAPVVVGASRRNDSAATIRPLPGASQIGREELWVIERAPQAREAAREDDTPRSGALMAKLSDKPEMVAVPLKHMDVKAGIAGYIATVDVRQEYVNPYDTKIEAVYVFPLPQNAAVNEFVMTIGERKIRGIIRERQEAEKIYHEARSQGYVASLLTQERPNVFAQKVANIEPGKQIDINIRYFHTLEYVDGWYEFVFPMVVGPRFNPSGMSDGIGAVGRDGRGASGQNSEVQYLRPNERSGHDIALDVRIDAGVTIENLQCKTHSIQVKKLEGARAEIALGDADRIPNKDFVLRYQVAAKQTKSALLASRDKRGGYFALMLYPPASLEDLPRQPLEMVFTLDVSGSMSGRPLEQSKAAMRYALRNMDARDTFQIIRFGDQAERMSRQSLPATRENVKRALNYVDSLQAGGGTMLVDGLRTSLEFPHDEGRLRFVAFLTDGYIGNEVEALREIHERLGPARIFSFGVGSSPNRYLMDQMAKMGRGAAAYLGLQEEPEEVMRPFFERISHPAMTDITVDWGGMKVSEVYPRRVPDLFVGRPVILIGRFEGGATGSIKIRGNVGGAMREVAVPVEIDETNRAPRSIPLVWARAKLADLAEQSVWQVNNELPQQARQVALEYGLMSPFTAFLAVDSSAQTAGNSGVTLNVPVPVPDGVKYETTVQEK